MTEARAHLLGVGSEAGRQVRLDGELELNDTPSDRDALALLSEAYARENVVIPLALSGGTLTVACASPTDGRLLHELKALTRHPIVALKAPEVEILQAIEERYELFAGVNVHIEAFRVHEASLQTTPLSAINENSPVVQIATMIIEQGLRDRASDIHLEPQQDRLRVRFRIDGLLTDAISLPATMGPSLSSRIKVLANMDIVDRHRAQDGQMRIDKGERHIDIRVSTAETIWGEKVVLRLLDQSRTILKLDQLGLEKSGFERVSRLLRSPYGMVVVSGPTGSGKTTTLYAAITQLDPLVQNITTIEDPVEYTFENINQMQIKKVANLTFANGLKAILRQDPDVILVGEIRDVETAEIAVQSALTGHLVLTSLHATDASGVIQRFIEMGVESFLVSSSLIGVVAQRLIRQICAACAEEYTPSPDEMALWREFRTDAGPFRHGRGCGHCAGTGFRGRTGVFEVLPVTEGIKLLITGGASAHQIREQAIGEGMMSMRAAAVGKVAEGVTTLSEVMRCVWLNQ